MLLAAQVFLRPGDGLPAYLKTPIQIPAPDSNCNENTITIALAYHKFCTYQRINHNIVTVANESFRRIAATNPKRERVDGEVGIGGDASKAP